MANAIRLSTMVYTRGIADLKLYFETHILSYRRNRAFRLYGSTKYGKTQSLQLPPNSAFYGSHVPTHSEILRDSLVCPFGSVQSLRRFAKENYRLLTFEESYQLERRISKSTYSTPNVGSSPYPTVDKYIESICTQGGVQGKIHSWSMNGYTISYSMVNNRYCRNIQRAHKSNNIIIQVHLQEKYYVQRCYDKDCAQYW